MWKELCPYKWTSSTCCWEICMDLLAVDVTDCPDVTVGSIATLIGKDGNEEISAPTVADNSESITNELLSRMGRRLKVIHKD